MLVGSDDKSIYAGETISLRDRLCQFDETRGMWEKNLKPPTARFFITDCPSPTRMAYQRRLILRHRPRLNLFDHINA